MPEANPMPSRELLCVMKGANFYRSAYLSDLAKIFELRALFTTRADEISNRHPSHFTPLSELPFSAAFVSGVKVGSQKIGFKLGEAIGRAPDLALVGLLDDVVSLQIMRRLYREGTPYILSLDGVGRRSRMIDMVFASSIRHAAGFLSPNSATDTMIRQLGGVAPVTRYHLGSRRASEIDAQPTSAAEKAQIRERLGVPTDLPTIISVGQTIPRKGFDTLIDAVAEIESACSIVIVGGTATSDLAGHVSRLPPRHRVTFVEHADKALLASYYRMADLFALATRGDSWGLVVNEALGYGLPVVTTTACGAGPELIDSECGAIVPPDSPAELGQAIAGVVKRISAGDELAWAALERAKTCTIEQMVEQTVQAVRTFGSAASHRYEHSTSRPGVE